MYAQAYANNDLAFIRWSYDQKIPRCLGFCLERIDKATGVATILPAWVGFENQKNEQWKARDTSIWPVQKFNWRDFTATRGKTYSYNVIPMVGTPGNLKQIADKSLHLHTNEVTLSPGSGDIKAYFNRGILSTQAVSHAIEGPNHTPSSPKLMTSIQTPGNELRARLMGQIKDALMEIIQEVKTNGGECYAALYELNDPELIDGLLSLGKKLHIILSNAGANGDDDPNTNEDNLPENQRSSRRRLHDAGIDITDRILGNGHIGHNKFLVYVNSQGKAERVLSGSTNWTYTGMCAQTNNAVLITSPELAKSYLDYWKALKADGAEQGADFRANNNEVHPVNMAPTKIDCWFSPNTVKKTKPASNPAAPGDMAEVFELMEKAQKSIQFLAFQPGSPSIMTKALEIQQANPKLYIRGAATDAKAVSDYNTSLLANESNKIDTVVAASNIKDQFAYWEQELLKSSNFAHAIIHDKIVVIDAYGDNPIVITGSHNLGYKASYANDENLLIIKGNKELANAYAVHVMDVYDHYRWRFILQSSPSLADAYHGLKTTDAWQDWYFKQAAPKPKPGSAPDPAGKAKPAPKPKAKTKKTAKAKAE